MDVLYKQGIHLSFLFSHFIKQLFTTGETVTQTTSLRGVCIYADGTWDDHPYNTKRPVICQWTGKISTCCHLVFNILVSKHSSAITAILVISAHAIQDGQ